MAKPYDLPAAAWTGELIDDRYRVGKKLGTGGMAIVYQATDERLEREVAIKILRTDREAGAGYARRLFREAKTGARVQHPNTISIFDVGNVGEIVYVVMELLIGRTLEDLVRAEKRLPPVFVMDIGRQSGEALSAIHHAGIVHRDIKPENMFVLDGSSGAMVKLLDFSIAKLSREFESAQLTMDGAVLGSAYYMSPEQVQAAPVSAQSDLYSLGCVMYECAVGRPPFDAETLTDLWDKHLSAPIPLVSDSVADVPEGFDDIVFRLMAKDPKNRPASAAKVARRFGVLMARHLQRNQGGGNQARGGRSPQLTQTERYKTDRHPQPDIPVSEQRTRQVKKPKR